MLLNIIEFSYIKLSIDPPSLNVWWEKLISPILLNKNCAKLFTL